MLSTITSTLEIAEKEEVLKTEYVKVIRIGSLDNVENVITLNLAIVDHSQSRVRDDMEIEDLEE